MSGELMRTEMGAQLPAMHPEAARALEQMAQLMRGMSDMIRTTNERMTALEQQVRMLTKITPAQAKALSAAIKERAGELCDLHRLPDCCGRMVADAIRREVKIHAGISALRELPRCEYQVTAQRVALWEDYKAIKAIKAKERGERTHE